MIKIEITGGPGTGKLALANKIRDLLQCDPVFNHPQSYSSVQLCQDMGVDGNPSSDGPDDANYRIFVHEE